MRRFCFAAAAVLFASVLDARAQGETIERAVRAAPGHDVRVGIYTDIRPDCTTGPLPAIRLAVAPAHGTVSVKRGTLKATNFKQCLGLDVPAFVAFYRAAAEFTGTDIFELEITASSGRKQRERVRVLVTKSPAAGEGI
jgi:phosphoribosylformylglycinamidine (FGAM) synthase PurS component